MNTHTTLKSVSNTMKNNFLKEHEVKWSLRQSMWKKTKGVLDIVKNTRFITLAGYHSYYEVKDYITEGTLRLDLLVEDLNKQQIIVSQEIEKDDLIVIFENGNRERALLVKMVGPLTYRKIPEVVIYRNKGYDNGYKEGKDVVQVSLKNHKQPKNWTNKEEMYALGREIEVVREITRDEPIFQKYWCRRSTVWRNSHNERFV